MKQLGLGVMIMSLGGNEETVNAIKASLGKKITKLYLGDELEMTFEDGTKMILADEGQSCCEYRYMSTDDTLSEYEDSIFEDIELKDAPDIEDEYREYHEVQFLDIKTSKGIFTISSHNEHNGYYGGFYITAKVFG